jgi:hypothetical protein
LLEAQIKAALSSLHKMYIMNEHENLFAFLAACFISDIMEEILEKIYIWGGGGHNKGWEVNLILVI